MPSNQGNLNKIVEETLNANGRTLKTVQRKVGNLETRESNTKTKFKKGLVYGAVISALLLCGYGSCKGLKAHSYSNPKEKAKVVYYQKQFDDVKYYYKTGNYLKADDISEKLQDEMSKESFFSPTKLLYKEVKSYDNEYIDPEVSRIKREKFYRDLKAIPGRMERKIGEKWDEIPPGGKFIIYACGVGILIYLLRKRQDYNKE